MRDRVDLIVAFEEESVRAAQAATPDIPVVFLHVVTDPVAAGFVASLAHPGGNLTGIAGDAPAKRMQLLKSWSPISSACSFWSTLTTLGYRWC